MPYIGIDCGLDGAIVMLDDNGHVLSTQVMPAISKGKGREIDIMTCNDWIRYINDCHDVIKVAIEDPGGHAPSAAGLRSMTYSYAVMKTLLTVHQIPYISVASQKWQSAFWNKPKMAKGTKFDTKGAALCAARRLFPSVELRKSERSTKPHDGIVDALLLAEYGRLTMK